MSEQPAGQIVPFTRKAADVRALLDRAKGQIAAALPSHIKAEHMIRVAFTSILKTPALLECDQKTLIGAVIEAAQLGLEPDGITGHAYLVPYGKKCQLIPGYKGLIRLARQSGEVTRGYARGRSTKQPIT